MLHACAATPELAYPADTHYPWTDPDGDIIKGGKLQFVDGAMEVPDRPGLGVEVDNDALAERHEQFLREKPDNRKDMILSLDPDAKSRDGSWTGYNFPHYAKPRW